MDQSFLAAQFSQALAYEPYLATGTDEHRRRWKQVYDSVTLTTVQTQLLSGFVRQMKVLVVSGIWCGDCVQQCPLIERIARGAGGKIDLRFVDRDLNAELAQQVRINDGDRVPIAIFMAEDGAWCGTYGDRGISRYRAMAVRQLGASCPVGILPPDTSETAATLADWLVEFERVQLMLRLSARLRTMHGD